MMYSQKSISDDDFDMSPEPIRGIARLKTEIAKMFGRGPDTRWGTQLMRIASDMILISDESLNILHHNRAFLKGIGYTQGSFKGKNLLHFFPSEDQDDATEAFARLKRGHAAGMRLNATFLTTKGRRQFDVRVVRNRHLDGTFSYYLISRDVAEQLESFAQLEDREADPLFWDLPVASWRTDENLRVLQAYGGLWADLGYTKECLIGGDLSERDDQILPPFLLDIDYCDTLTGMTLHTEVVFNDEPFNVTVEPFLDTDGNIVGTIGILRRSKVLNRVVRLERSETLGATSEHRPHLKTRRVSLEPVAAANTAQVASHRQRPLTPPAQLISTRQIQETADLDAVALAN